MNTAYKNPQQKSSKFNPAMHGKSHIPQANMYYRYANLASHLKITQCKPPYHQAKEKKSYDHNNQCSKHLTKLNIPL